MICWTLSSHHSDAQPPRFHLHFQARCPEHRDACVGLSRRKIERRRCAVLPDGLDNVAVADPVHTQLPPRQSSRGHRADRGIGAAVGEPSRSLLKAEGEGVARWARGVVSCPGLQLAILAVAADNERGAAVQRSVETQPERSLWRGGRAPAERSHHLKLQASDLNRATAIACRALLPRHLELEHKLLQQLRRVVTRERQLARQRLRGFPPRRRRWVLKREGAELPDHNAAPEHRDLIARVAPEREPCSVDVT